MKPIKVLIATGTMNAGGAETIIMEQLRQRTDAVEYSILIHYAGKISKGVYDEEIKDFDIPVIYIHSVGSVGERQYMNEFCQIVEEKGPFDVVHSHLNAVGGIIVKAAKKAGIKSRIVHCHADITFKGNWISRMINEVKLQYMRMYIDKYANQFWACSEDAAKRLFYQKRLQDSVVIPNIIDVEKYLTDETMISGAKAKFGLLGKQIIGAVGRIARIKNYEFVVELLKRLKDKNQMFEFVCLGRIADEEYYEEIVNKARKLGVYEQLHFLGNSTDIAFDIHCFDIFVMPSYSEGFGMAAIEAQAAGIPSVASEGVPKIVDVGAGLIEFISIQDMERWTNIIMKKCKEKPVADHKFLIECFDKKGFNSVTTARRIEQKYKVMNREA